MISCIAKEFRRIPAGLSLAKAHGFVVIVLGVLERSKRIEAG